MLRLLLLTVLVSVPLDASAQVIDRVLAIVAGAPITLSDANAAVRFALVPGQESATDPMQVLDALIDRQLQLTEVDRYLPPEPPASEIAPRMEKIRARFATAEAFESAMKETGMTPATLTAYIRDTLRIEIYLEQRFGAGSQPSDDDVLKYYKANPATFTREGTLRSFADAREDARRTLMDDRRRALVRTWLAGLRRRADVSILGK